MRWLVVLALVVGCSSVACSSDGGGDDAGVELETTQPTGDPRAAAVIAAAIVGAGEDAPSAMRYDDASARCIAERIVAGFEPERLVELGLDVDEGTPPQLSSPPLTAEEAAATFEIFDHCVDFVAMWATLIGDGYSLTDAVANCAAQRYHDSGQMREDFLATGEADHDVSRAIDDAIAACR